MSSQELAAICRELSSHSRASRFNGSCLDLDMGTPDKAPALGVGKPGTPTVDWGFHTFSVATAVSGEGQAGVVVVCIRGKESRDAGER